LKPILHGARVNAATLMGKELYRVEDGLGSIVVTQRGEKRVLSFDMGLEQSSVLINKPYYLSHEYTQIMLLGLVFTQPKHLTLLGLGGGGLAHCLSHYYPQVSIQVVEIRQAVIDIAYEWFELPRQSNLQVSCVNALKHMRQAEAGHTDLILSDLYESTVMSEVQAHQSFIESCYRALSEGGWIVFNFHELPAEDSAVMEAITNLFSEIYICDVFKGNWVMFCGKSESEYSKPELTGRARDLVKKVEMPLMYYFKQLQRL